MKPSRGFSGSAKTGLALACLFAWLAATAWMRPLMSPDEGRYAAVALEMLRSGDWLVPRLDGLPFFHKPPLFYWVSAAAMGLLGPSEWAARLPSMIGAMLAAGGLFLFLLRWADPARTVLATVVLATMPFFYVGAQFANLDMLVAGCIAATLLLAAHAALSKTQGGAWRAALAGAFAFAGLGVLAKGLIGLLLPAVIYLAWCLAIRRPRLAALMVWPPGWLLLLAIAVPWFVAVELRHPGFLDYFIVTQHFRRFASGGFNGEHPFWFYVPVVAVLTMPWIAWLALALRPGRAAHPPRAEVDWLMGIWCVGILAFFSVPHSKLVGYVLPALPPLASLVAKAALDAGLRLVAVRVTAIVAASACLGGLAWMAAQPAPPGYRLRLPAGESMRATDQMMMLGAYYYELPFYWALDRPVKVLADWTQDAVAQRDDWRRELYEAGRFDPARSAALLVDVRRAEAALCVPEATWLVGASAAASVLPWLARARLVAVGGDTAIWRFPGSARRDPDCLGPRVAPSP